MMSARTLGVAVAVRAMNGTPEIDEIGFQKLYSSNLNTGLVWYLNGHQCSICRLGILGNFVNE